MKITFIIISILLTQYSFGQADTFYVNQIKFFTVKKGIKTEYEKTDTIIKLYRFDKAKPKYLFSYYLYRYGADCNNVFEDIGNFTIKGDKIVLFTKFHQKGHDPIPDSEEIIYYVKPNGLVILLSKNVR